jgi:hypothetical protein
LRQRGSLGQTEGDGGGGEGIEEAHAP